MLVVAPVKSHSSDCFELLEQEVIRWYGDFSTNVQMLSQSAGELMLAFGLQCCLQCCLYILFLLLQLWRHVGLVVQGDMLNGLRTQRDDIGKKSNAFSLSLFVLLAYLVVIQHLECHAGND